MLAQGIVIGIALLVPQSHIYGGKRLDAIRCAVKCLRIDFRDAELNRVFDCKDKTTESIMVDVAYDRIVVSTVETGTWPPRLTPLVTVWRKNPNYARLHHLVRIEPCRIWRGLISPRGER